MGTAARTLGHKPGCERHVILLDSDKDRSTRICKQLTTDLVKVACFHAGSDALNVLRYNLPDLLILSHGTPDMSSIALLSELECANGVPPFVVIGPDPQDEVAMQLKHRGSLGYIRTDNGFWSILPSVVTSAMERADANRRLRRLEKERSDQAKLNQLLLETLAHPALLIKRGYETVAVNEAAAREGFEPGKRCCTSTSENAALCSWCKLEAALDSGQSQHAIVDRNGKQIEAHWRPLNDELCLQYHFDSTEKRRAEEERHKLEAQLGQVQKMEAIGQLAGGIAHDFGNLLSSIAGYAELQRQCLDYSTDAFRYAQRIAETAERARELTRNLLTFSRKSEIANRPVDLHKTLHDTVELLKPSCKGITIELGLAAQSSLVMGDENQLQAAFLNMGLNARDAMTCGGTLTFETDLATLGGLVTGEEPSSHDGAYVRVLVRDTGNGMDQATMSRIFEPFYTTKEEGKGTGLGLSSVYGTVKSHKGAVEVESTPGEGTTFTVLLPVAGSRQAVLAEEQQMQKPESAVAMTIETKESPTHLLLVDDNDLVRAVAQRMLEDLGHKVTAFDQGPPAVAFYREHTNDVDLAVLDVVIPGMHGQDIFRELKAINPNVRAIFITGYEGSVDIDEVRREGLLGVINKPFRMHQLCAAISDALASKLA